MSTVLTTRKKQYSPLLGLYCFRLNHRDDLIRRLDVRELLIQIGEGHVMDDIRWNQRTAQ